MTLPRFSPENDPGPDFSALIDKYGMPAISSQGIIENLPHGTTCVAIKYNDGVVLAGDRRATSGHHISFRTIEKVFQSDSHSGVAISGAAGPAVEMVKLFQLQLEHYEKVEGNSLSLEGKANQLGNMIRQNLPAAMQGLAVVPIFAGYDLRENAGRIFQYDVTGGRFEEAAFATTGSGSLHATTVIKMGFKDKLNQQDAVALAANAIFEASDEDSATGGPDLIRDLFPTIAVIKANGFEMISHDKVVTTFTEIINSRKEQNGGT
ncbi:MAG: proteasome subunit beta [Acidimicrobiales bacterium]|nr:proteasome subunit beta [Acidimicrobiales bacterium]HJM27583.1 proteasome subunit beta [Acidimicrobiales bacterium]HJM96545.1 proteasome subunit beta [Acidimicrobiales bacterium]